MNRDNERYDDERGGILVLGFALMLVVVFVCWLLAGVRVFQ